MKKLQLLSLALALSTFSSLVHSAEASKAKKSEATDAKVKAQKEPASEENVNLGEGFFDAMSSGKISVEFIAKDATRATVIIHNKTDKPIDVRLPETFAAVPEAVLAQMGGMGGMGGGMGGMGGGMGGMGGGQGMGGGMGGGGMGGMGGGGMGGMGGMMRVETNKPAKIQAQTVCLEFGKKDPNPRMKYAIIPLDKFNSNPEVAEICAALGRNELSQNVAQAAAWHVANDLSWERLRTLPKVVSRYTGIEFYFTDYEVAAARRAVTFVQSKSAESEYNSDYTSYKSGE